MNIIFMSDKRKLFEKVVTLNLEFKEIRSINLYLKDSLNVVAQLPSKSNLSKDLIKLLSQECIYFIKKNKIRDFAIDMSSLDLDLDYKYLFLKNLILESYEFNIYKNDCKVVQHQIYIFEEDNQCEKISEIKLLTNTIKFIKDLINTPANELKPNDFVDIAKNQGKALKFDVDILSEKEILKNNMNGIYSVGKGSKNKPYVLILKYNGNPSTLKTFGLVGKGVTFDSGGYSLKSTTSMLNMKNDMGGAAISLGVFCMIVEKKLNINITAVIPLCENMISNSSYKPGDIIKMMSGLTVEIENTDCEGRLILADAIHYITCKENISKFLTIATLTGGAYNTFGEEMTPVFSNDDNFYEKISNASSQTEDLIWRMPLEKKYKKFIIGNLGDLKNSSGKVGGLISSALFLKEFNHGNKPWCHFDIAGNIINESNKLASGKTVEFLYNLIKNEVKI